MAEPLSVILRVDAKSVDSAIKKLKSVAGEGGGLDTLAKRVKGTLSGTIEAGGATGGKGAGLAGLAGTLGSLSRIAAPIMAIAVIAKGVMSVIEPILDTISMVVAILVLPLAMLIQAILRPVLTYLFKFLIFAMGALKYLIGFLTGDAKLMGEGLRDMGMALGGDLGKALMKQGQAMIAAAESGKGGAVGIFDFEGLTKALNDLIKTLKPEEIAKGVGETAAKVAGVAEDIAKGAGEIASQAIKGGEDIITGITEHMMRGAENAWTLLSGIGGWVVESLKVVLTAVWDFLAPLATWLWDTATGILQTAWDELNKFGAWLWDTLAGEKGIFPQAWKSLVGLGSTIWNMLMGEKGVFPQAWAALSGLGTAIYSAFMGVINAAIEFAKSLFGLGGKKEGGGGKVGDAIIAPGGNIISTNPADYLIATKNPTALLGAGGITMGNINVTIAGSASKADADAIAERIWHEFETNLKRAGYASGSR